MNQPVQGVYRVTPTGTVELLNTTQSPPNGVALSPDESTLYVGGATLTAHPVMADGSVGAGTPFGNNLSGTDGFAIDCAGHVYVALHNEGMVIVLDKDGNQLDGNFSVSQVTNMAFGGPENRTLFVTSFGDNKGQLRSVELEVPGYPF
jgi:gluconolactonase